MPEISRFLGIVIAMYANDHNPPHFHARYNGQEEFIAIRSLIVIAGDLPSRELKLVMEWAALHQEELMEDWYLLHNEKKFNRIAPLA
jgi:phosphomannomutase